LLKNALTGSWIWFSLAALIGAAVAWTPAPHGLSRPSQLVLAVTALTIALWMFRAIGNGIASVLMMALMVAIGVRPALALSGFSSPSFWVLLAVLFYGFAMQQTGLAKESLFTFCRCFRQPIPASRWRF